MHKKNILILCVFILFPLLANAESDHRAWLRKILEIAQSHFTFSTTFSYEMENKVEIVEEIDHLVTNALILYGDQLDFKIPCIRLLYIQGNFFLYNDRPIEAQNKLLLAKKLCEEGMSSIQLGHPLIFFKFLKEQDVRLPSMYALILHLLGKAYVFPKDPLTAPYHEEGLALIKESLLWRKMIDHNIHEVADHLDNNVVVGNTHIFERTLGYALLEQNRIAEALGIFLDCYNMVDPLNQLICLKNLVRIYQKMCQLTSDNALKETYYKQGAAASVQLLQLLQKQPKIYRESVYFCIVGDFFSDIENPFFDKTIAAKCYEIAKKTSDQSLLFIIKRASEGLFNCTLSEKEKIKAEAAWGVYRENNCYDLLKRPLTNSVMIKLFEQLGDCFSEKSNVFYASVFYVNAIALARKISHSTEALEHKNYLLLKNLSPTLSFAWYTAIRLEFKTVLSRLRQEFDQVVKVQETSLIQKFFCEKVFEFLIKVIESFSLLPDLHKDDFTIIAGGSLARETQTLYSDLELAFLINENLSEAKRQRVEALFTYLSLFLTSLEETPLYYIRVIDISPQNCCKRGIMLDPAMIAPLEYLIKTPAEFIEKMFDSTETSCLNLTFLNHKFVYGSENLFQDFQLKLKENSQKKFSVLLKAMENDLKRWSPKIAVNKEGFSLSVKHDLYKPLFTLLDHLFALHSLIGPYDPWKNLDELQKKHVLDNNSKTLLIKTINDIIYIRQSTYSTADSQNERFYFYSLSSIINFIQMQHAIVLLQNLVKPQIQNFLNNKKMFIKLSFLDSFSLNMTLLAKLAIMHLTSYDAPLSTKHLKARYQPSFSYIPLKFSDKHLISDKLFVLLMKKFSNHLNKFDLKSPQRSLYAFLYGYLLQLKDEHQEAIKFFNSARKTDEKIYGPHHLKIAAYYYRLALSYYTLDDLTRAYFYIQKAHEIHATLIGKSHRLTQKDLNLIKQIENTSDLFKDKEKALLLKPFAAEWPRKKFLKIFKDLCLLDLYGLDPQVKGAMEKLELINASYYFY